MVKLSASKIKTLDTCSWTFHCKYVLKLPDTANKGALMGSCAHFVLECLLNKRHKKKFDTILKDKKIHNEPVVARYVKQYLDKHGVDQVEFDTISDFIYTALNSDFFLEGYELMEPELKFDIENENPPYHITGFIDKLARKGDELIKIVDYKSAKQKPSQKEQKFNIQGMMYILAMKKMFPEVKKTFVNFLYLRFKKSPLQVCGCTDGQLKGLEDYLTYITEYIEQWSMSKAHANFAKDNAEKRMLCGTWKDRTKDDGSAAWRCPMMKPFDYYALLDDKGNVIRTSFKNDLIPKEKQVIEKRFYQGCPAHTKYYCKDVYSS